MSNRDEPRRSNSAWLRKKKVSLGCAVVGSRETKAARLRQTRQEISGKIDHTEQLQ
jgi:hypothetical protein